MAEEKDLTEQNRSDAPLEAAETAFAENGSPDAELPELRPMSYRDLMEEQPPENSSPGIQPAAAEPDSLLFPPFSAPKKDKKTFLLQSLLWIMSVLLVAMGIVTVFSFSHRRENKQEAKTEASEVIPDNNRAQASYGEEYSLPGAPQVSADPNGPQASLVSSPDFSRGSVAHQAFEKAAPSVVSITSYEGGGDYVLNKLGDGSGIVYSEDGWIVTNSHVVDDKTTTGVMVTTYDGTAYLGTIIGVDPKTDLAVLKIDAKNLTKGEFADSDTLFVGQEVYAIGSPGGSNFSNSMTKGCVSALNRVLSSNGYVKYIQTDAAINPGNSGGALINENGQIVGMNTSKIVSTNYEGMGFSIPSNKLVEIANKLIRDGYIKDRGTLSIEGTSCNLYESKLKNVPQGMVITKINVDSPMFDTRAEEKDIITAINDVRVKSVYEFIDQLAKYKPGDTIKLTLFRSISSTNSKEFSFDMEVTLIEDTSWMGEYE